VPIDLTPISEAELIDLHRRIVERLRLIQSARPLTALANFSIGMSVDFATDDGRTIRGSIARLNRRTATIVTATGSWRVSPSLPRAAGVDDAAAPAASSGAARVLPMPRARRRQ
jgi:hypothetical protein